MLPQFIRGTEVCHYLAQTPQGTWTEAQEAGGGQEGPRKGKGEYEGGDS